MFFFITYFIVLSVHGTFYLPSEQHSPNKVKYYYLSSIVFCKIPTAMPVPRY